MARLPKALYRFKEICIKLPMKFFTELEQIILKCILSHKRPWITKAILRKKNWAGGITLPDFREHYKATGTKRAQHWDKNRHMGQWNRTQSLEMNPHTYRQPIFHKEARIPEWVAFHFPGDLPDPGIETISPALAGRFFTTEIPCILYTNNKIEKEKVRKKKTF